MDFEFHAPLLQKDNRVYLEFIGDTFLKIADPFTSLFQPDEYFNTFILTSIMPMAYLGMKIKSVPFA